MTSAQDYAITIQRVTDGDRSLYRATVRELPDVADYADLAAEAYALALESIESLAKMAKEAGRAFPRPGD